MEGKPQTATMTMAERDEIIVRRYTETTPQPTLKELADWVVAAGLMPKCTRQNMSRILHRADLEPAALRAKAQTPSAAYCPWVVRVEHANDPVYRFLLRYAKFKLRPEAMTERDQKLFDSFRAEMDRLNAIICHYDPYDAKGRFFWLRARRPGEEGKYVVGPDGIAR